MFDSLFPKEWTTLQRLMWLKTNALARAVYETVTGNPVSFTARNAPLRQLEVAFSPVQDLHGYDAPWPAGGGKNKFDKSTVTANTYVNSGGSTSGSSDWSASDYIVASENTTYTFSGSGATGIAAHTAFYDASKVVISTIVSTQTTLHDFIQIVE